MGSGRTEVRSNAGVQAPASSKFMSAFTSEGWARLWRDAKLSGSGNAWFEALAERYAEPHRYYHTSRHIAECLAEVDHVRHLARDPVAVELALWFHDAIYETHAA